jgi:hypothetical protein
MHLIFYIVVVVHKKEVRHFFVKHEILRGIMYGVGMER